MHDDEVIPQAIRALVEGHKSVWMAEHFAFSTETGQLVADVLGVSPEQVWRHRDIGIRLDEATFSFPIPDTVSPDDGFGRYPYGRPYILAIDRSLKRAPEQRWKLSLKGFHKEQSAEARAEMYDASGRFGHPSGATPVALWFAAESVLVRRWSWSARPSG